MRKRQTVLVTGTAMAPQDTVAYGAFGYTAVVLEVDTATHTIVEADSSSITELARGFVRDLLVGYDLTRGLEPLIAEVRSHYLSPRARAVVRCLEIAYQRYRDHFPDLPGTMDPGEGETHG